MQLVNNAHNVVPVAASALPLTASQDKHGVPHHIIQMCLRGGSARPVTILQNADSMTHVTNTWRFVVTVGAFELTPLNRPHTNDKLSTANTLL